MADFDGDTYDHDRDHERLVPHLDRVQALMADHQWHLATELEKVGGPSWSSRVRDLRKEKFGAHLIESRYATDGLWEYRMLREGDALPETPRRSRLGDALALVTQERDEALDKIDRALALMDSDPACRREAVRHILEGSNV